MEKIYQNIIILIKVDKNSEKLKIVMSFLKKVLKGKDCLITKYLNVYFVIQL